MSFAQYIPNFPTIIPSADWSSIVDAMADMVAQWGIDFGSTRTIVVYFWEGPNDPDDYAKLTVTTGTGAQTIAFDSMPYAGAPVFVVGISFT